MRNQSYGSQKWLRERTHSEAKTRISFAAHEYLDGADHQAAAMVQRRTARNREKAHRRACRRKRRSRGGMGENFSPGAVHTVAGAITAVTAAATDVLLQKRGRQQVLEVHFHTIVACGIAQRAGDRRKSCRERGRGVLRTFRRRRQCCARQWRRRVQWRREQEFDLVVERVAIEEPFEKR